MNDATDQKIPRIIRPIPDEMEEFNLKGSISIDQTDKEDERDNRNDVKTRNYSGNDRILV